MGAHRAAPADVDVAELYDGFSILTMVWLEELGLCGKGESGPFVEGGQRIALDGRHAPQHQRRPALGRPAARLRHAARGLRPAARPGRRAPGPGAPEVAAVAAGGGPIAGCMLLTRGPSQACDPPRADPLADTNVSQLRSRAVRLHYDEETEAFRRELRAWMEANLPPRRNSARAGALLGAHPASGHGPGSASCSTTDGWCRAGPPSTAAATPRPVQQMVYFEELARLGVPRSCNPQGLSIITPSILDWGTEEQKARYALPTLRAEISWCLGMSEPNAGSDLAGLRTRAELARGPLRRQRPEGVDLGGPRLEFLLLLRAHRSRGRQARRHQRAHHRHDDARASRPGPSPS